ncbi:reverse transcriptase domain-containing protein, partial [Tanacetum coccineum]
RALDHNQSHGVCRGSDEIKVLADSVKSQADQIQFILDNTLQVVGAKAMYGPARTTYTIMGLVAANGPLAHESRLRPHGPAGRRYGHTVHGRVEGMFLGYMISPDGIKPCPEKTKTVLQLPSPRTIKEVQSLNGKLASLNKFLSKSAKKSLPLFKTLKKCIKMSDFHWTPEAEQAFKQLKQRLSELPMLVAPKPKEELIVYLFASYGAVSAVLMTERGTV